MHNRQTACNGERDELFQFRRHAILIGALNSVSSVYKSLKGVRFRDWPAELSIQLNMINDTRHNRTSNIRGKLQRLTNAGHVSLLNY